MGKLNCIAESGTLVALCKEVRVMEEGMCMGIKCTHARVLRQVF